MPATAPAPAAFASDAEENELESAPARGVCASMLVNFNAPPFSSSFSATLRTVKNAATTAAASSFPEQEPQSPPSASFWLETGLEQLDDRVLQGGFIFGRGGIVCINYDTGATGGAVASDTMNPCSASVVAEELLYSTLTSHLLSYPVSQAYFIDPLGQFSPFRLHENLIRRRIRTRRNRPDSRKRHKSTSKSTPQAHKEDQQHRGDSCESDNGREGQAEAENHEEAALKALDRVAIMRVFDFAGLMEAIDEIRERLTPKGDRSTQNLHPEDTEIASAQPFVADSQPGSEDEAEITIEADSQTFASAEQDSSPLASTHALGTELKPEQEAEPALILIPSIHSLISPFMRINHVRGHASMLRFSRALQSLTSSHPLCCIMCSSTVASSTAAYAFPKQPGQRGEQQQRPKLHGPSIFAVNAGIKPALGRSWPYCIDLNLLITQPLSSVATTNEHKQAMSMATARRNDVTVLEVLADRYSNRVGRWCTL